MAAFYYTNQKQESNLLEYVPKNFVIKTLLFPETESQVAHSITSKDLIQLNLGIATRS